MECFDSLESRTLTHCSPQKLKLHATTGDIDIPEFKLDNMLDAVDSPEKPRSQRLSVHPKVFKIVLTGGPCAGKTTSLTRIKSFLENRGAWVCVIPEAATLLRTSGIRWSPVAPNAFQIAIGCTQRTNEDVWARYASTIAEAKQCNAVLLMDRGLVDGSCYVNDEKFAECMSECGVNGGKAGCYKRYDMVLHMVTAAKGAEKFYTPLDGIRHETIEEARVLDTKLKNAWENHPEHHVFDNHGSFEEKMQRVVHQFCKFLKIPDTKRLPHRYLLTKIPDCFIGCIPSGRGVYRTAATKVYITSERLSSEVDCIGSFEATESKCNYSFVRMRKSNERTSYVFKRVTEEEGQRIERKNVITKRQYEERQKLFADPSRSRTSRFANSSDRIRD